MIRETLQQLTQRGAAPRALSARLGVGLLLCAAFASAPASAQEEPKGPPPRPKAVEVVLTGVTVHPVVGPVAKDVRVWLSGGKIRAIGPKVALDAKNTLDLTGKHLYPGLLDADSALGLTEIMSVDGTRDTREVGAINPNLRAEIAINPDSRLFAVARTGGVLLTHVAARSGLIAGTSAVIATQGWTYEDMRVRAPALLQVRWPAMRIETRGMTAEQITEAQRKRDNGLAKIQAAFREARAYWAARRTRGARRERDPKWEAMRDVVAPAAGQRRVNVAVHAETLAQIRAALDWGRRERLALVIVGGADAWRATKELKAGGVPVILGPMFRQPRRAHEPVDTAFKVAARLHEAGIRFAFSTGGSAFAAANARHLRLHAAQAVAHGVPPKVAVAAMTLEPAKIFGLDQRLGSIEVGKDATLIVTDRELLDDRAKVVKAWIAGRPVGLRDKQLELYERYLKKPR